MSRVSCGVFSLIGTRIFWIYLVRNMLWYFTVHYLYSLPLHGSECHTSVRTVCYEKRCTRIGWLLKCRNAFVSYKPLLWCVTNKWCKSMLMRGKTSLRLVSNVCTYDRIHGSVFMVFASVCGTDRTVQLCRLIWVCVGRRCYREHFLMCPTGVCKLYEHCPCACCMRYSHVAIGICPVCIRRSYCGVSD